LYESAEKLGGHVNTVVVEEASGSVAVDTGFIVFNEKNYPGLVGLFDELEVETQPSDMSFSVASNINGLEYCGSSLNGLFARRSNLFRPSFWRMLLAIPRFNREAKALLAEGTSTCSLDEFLHSHRFSGAVVDDYLIPMGAAIWSANPQTFSAFPAVTLFRFLDNHGLLSLRDRPQWRTVKGGSHTYVHKIEQALERRVKKETPVLRVERAEGGVVVNTHAGSEMFDRVIFACHADTALALLASPTSNEQNVLSKLRFQANRATLHTDETLLPRRRAWASWNYRRTSATQVAPVLTYFANRLQSLKSQMQYCITLNADEQIATEKIIASFDYFHPIFDGEAVAAQQLHHTIDGVGSVHYAGAYWAYGFHEDGVQSALRVLRNIGVPTPLDAVASLA
jgi:predicted NAD/FAD-binding protein